MKACLTIDMEELSDSVIWHRTEKRIDINEAYKRINGILEKHDIRATFFLLGTFAEKHKDIVHELRKNGHEIACHFYTHENMYMLNKDEIRAGISRCKRLLGKMRGFRAPIYSVHKLVLDVLKAEGFAYDSSVFPSLIYPHPSVKRLKAAFRIADIEGQPYMLNGILEVPITVFPSYVGLPVTGTTIRVYGQLIARLIRFYRKQYFVFNMHPFEFLDAAPRINNTPFWFQRNTGQRFIRNLERIITALKRNGADFITMQEVKAFEG